MRYMLLIHTDESAVPAPAPNGVTPLSSDYAAYGEAMRKAGVALGGDRLQPASTAASVRIKNGETLVLDGPYMEAKEQLGGFYMIDVPTIDQAIEWAARCPAAARGTVEVRQIWELTR